MILQPRDRKLCEELALLRVIDCEQAKVVAGFGSTSRANRRLLQLTRAGLLRRFFLGSGGGRKALYALSEKGALHAGAPVRGPRRAQGAILVADGYIDHQLSVNWIYCTVKFGRIPVPGLAFHRWVAFYEPIAPNIRLIPDGYFEFTADSGIAAAFLEVDRGTESLGMWKEKVRQYLELASSGTFHKTFGQDRFRVLVAANSERRAESIRKTVAEITQKIFRFTTVAEAQRNFFGQIWIRPVVIRREPLFESQS